MPRNGPGIAYNPRGAAAMMQEAAGERGRQDDEENAGMAAHRPFALALLLGLAFAPAGQGALAAPPGLALPAPGPAAPVTAQPFQPGGEELLEEVRWVNRCHQVRDHRHRSGWRQVCRRVWVEPPRHHHRPHRRPGPPPPPHWR